MSKFDTNPIPYSPAPSAVLPRLEPAERAFDIRWIHTAALLTGLIAFAALVATIQGYRPGVNLSARTALVYCPMAGALILMFGWTNATFPIAAALFYGFLGINQMSSANYFFLGDNTGALTFEMLLALPLLLVGFVGTPGSAYTPSQRLPTVFPLAWAMLALSALLATLFAVDVGIAFPTLIGRYWLPILVTLAVFRRLRNLADYEVVWLGLLIGLAVVSVYNYRRGVLGEMEWYATSISQRFLGSSQSYAIPAVFAAGGALWLGHGHALRRSMTIGVLLMLAVAIFGLLNWLGASRGAVLFFLLLVAWWTITSFAANLLSGRALIFLVVGGAAAVSAIVYSLGRTTLDVHLTIDRLQTLWSGGMTGSARWQIWEKAMDHWAQHPLFGVGLNNWVVVDAEFASVHSSLVGAFFDLGLCGVAALTLLFFLTIYYARPGRYRSLPFLDMRFLAGSFAGGVVMSAFLAVNLPFTSGQPRNNTLAYVLYMFPLLAMTMCARHSPPPDKPPAQPMPPLDANLNVAERK